MTPDADAPSPTESSNGTATDDGAGTDDGTATDGATTDNRTAEMSGDLLVALGGEDTHFTDAADADSSFWINESENHTWHADTDSLTLAEALDEIGLDASEDSLTYDGTTYSEDDENTSIAYRVNGEIVEDPSERELESGALIVVQVNTGDEETPGRYVTDHHPHPHGTLDITVDGEQLNLTGEEYTMADRYFHFHGDEEAERWHGHSVNITVAYAISTFPEMNLTDDSFTHEGTTYDVEDGTVNVTVNGESVEPESHTLKDGDDISIDVSEE